MGRLQNLKADALLNTMACLLAAFIFGSAIGLERQYRQRNAGLRTNVLVSVGSAGFCRISGLRWANQVNCGAQTQDKSICSASKVCAFLSM